MSGRRQRWRRPAALAATAAVLAAAAFLPVDEARAADSSTTPAIKQVLVGTGAYDPYQELTAWTNDLASSDLSVNYIPQEGYLGRQQLLSGDADFAISGVGFTPSELSTLPNGAADLISAPVFASALGELVVRPPSSQLNSSNFGIQHWSCDPSQDSCQNDPNTTETEGPYTGPLNLPPSSLAAMMLQPSLPLTKPTTYKGSPITTWAEWDNPQIVEASDPSIATDDQFQGPQYGNNQFPPVVLQSGGGEEDYYAQVYARDQAPSVWSQIQTANRFTASPVTDTLPPQLASLTRPGDTEVMQYLEGSPGVVGLVPPSATTQFASDPAAAKLNPKETAQFLGVQNAAGEYQTPSPATIDAAVNAGGATPLYALDNSVPGAYPLAYVDDLYAPAHGLSADKTEALASLIRYLATAGQEATAPENDGRLSPALTAQALAAANQLEQSNCTGSGVTLSVSTDPGPDMPKLTAGSAGAKDIANIGSMLHCTQNVATPSATTSTTAKAAGSTSTNLPSTPYAADNSAAGLSSITPVASSALQTSVTPSGSGTVAAARTAAAPSQGASGSTGSTEFISMPLPLPTSPTGSRIAGLLLGALLVLVLRRPARWLLRAFQP